MIASTSGIGIVSSWPLALVAIAIFIYGIIIINKMKRG